MENFIFSAVTKNATSYFWIHYYSVICYSQTFEVQALVLNN